jgi:hypothetical protein
MYPKAQPTVSSAMRAGLSAWARRGTLRSPNKLDGNESLTHRSKAIVKLISALT